jgi:hypothetical protein
VRKELSATHWRAALQGWSLYRIHVYGRCELAVVADVQADVHPAECEVALGPASHGKRWYSLRDHTSDRWRVLIVPNELLLNVL